MIPNAEWINKYIETFINYNDYRDSDTSIYELNSSVDLVLLPWGGGQLVSEKD